MPFRFSGISSGAAVALIAMALRHRSIGYTECTLSSHGSPGRMAGAFRPAAFFVGLALGDDGKVRALAVALGGGFWTWWFWLGVAGLGLIMPMLLNPGVTAVRVSWRAGGCGASLTGVLLLRFFFLYAGQLTVA
ncbi:NrfD/PsrC family molybdoenzyme membrane anchor subunit [Shigella flexneri]